MKYYYVYILASHKCGTLYIGITNDLVRRVYEHKNGLTKGFTSLYKVDKLVYFEDTTDVYGAIEREKQLKKWRREWKIQLIESTNPEWKDLYTELIDN
jgi:putative endonuclease